MYGNCKNNLNIKQQGNNNIKQLLQYQILKHDNISDARRIENSFLQEKLVIKNIGNNNFKQQNHQIGFMRTNSSSFKTEKKLPYAQDKQLNYPLTASAVMSTRSISKNASLNNPKLNLGHQIDYSQNKLNNLKTKKEINLASNLTLSPSNNRYNEYSPNKINCINKFLYEKKQYLPSDNPPEKKSNYLIQSLKIAKSNFNLLENMTKENFVSQKYESVKEIASKEEQNPRYRQSMEDFMKMIDKYNGDSNSGLFMLFDGHGGKDAAVYVKEKFADFFSKFLTQSNSTPEKALILTFQKIDLDLKNRNIANENVGTTASVVYLTKEADIICGTKRVIYAANVGDSRIILLQNSGPKKISYDHRCNDSNEINRIKQAGGIIFNCRVFGQLALTRAIGDHSFKKYGVIATPYTNKVYIDEKDRYLIIASDGVWDTLSDYEVYKLSLNNFTAVNLANSIVKTAITRGSKDNTSCIVVKL